MAYLLFKKNYYGGHVLDFIGIVDIEQANIFAKELCDMMYSRGILIFSKKNITSINPQMIGLVNNSWSAMYSCNINDNQYALIRKVLETSY